jgi:molecular chaperone Hsp33
MRKKEPYGETLREQLLASARDKLHSFLLSFGELRGAFLSGTRLVNEMRANHELGPLETLLLGQAYLAAGLMSSSLKAPDQVKLRIDCSGPARGLSVEANAFGEVRGYLFRSPIPARELSQAPGFPEVLGGGVLTVTRQLRDARQPFTSQIELEHGTLAEDLARYYLLSEQTPAAMSLSVKFDECGTVTGAGGLLLQVMPEADPDTVGRVEALFRELPSVGGALTEDGEPEELIREWFAPFSPLLLGNRRVAFMCHCSARRFRGFLGALPLAELRDMLDSGPFPIVTTCFNCNTGYEFSRREIESLYRSALGRENASP